MGTFLDIVERENPPIPWKEGDNIPWDEPGFSERMLREHLTQTHDWASRRAETIDSHVAWVHDRILGGRPSDILDLGCGPGLYTSRLARLGHRCVGIDYSPASIAHARAQCAAEGLSCTYHEGDLRRTPFGQDFDAVLLVYGELNVFSREDARRISKSAHDALRAGGTLVLEVSCEASIRRDAGRAPSWTAPPTGLFHDGPHLRLQEHFWCEELRAATTRWYVVASDTGVVQRYALSVAAYRDVELVTLLRGLGFVDVTCLTSMTGETHANALDFFVVTARRPDGV